LKLLEGKVAVVTGGTRGAGRGIAVSLGEAGATVYVTGRSVRGNLSSMGRPETIEETAEMINARGGVGIPVRVDHTVEEEVHALFDRVRKEQNGRLDILVNDIWGGDPLTEWGVPFWEHSLENGLLMQKCAVHTHIYQPLWHAAHGRTRTRTDHRSNGRHGLSISRESLLQLGQNLGHPLGRGHGG
jgi:NAD(P)-dependent dehydrogenase (short-subunit alcohol dehydrogenase family)